MYFFSANLLSHRKIYRERCITRVNDAEIPKLSSTIQIYRALAI